MNGVGGSRVQQRGPIGMQLLGPVHCTLCFLIMLHPTCFMANASKPDLSTLVRGMHLRLLCAAMPCVLLYPVLHLDTAPVEGPDAHMRTQPCH